MSWYVSTIDRKKIQIGFTDIPRTDNADGSIGTAGVNGVYKSDFRPPPNTVNTANREPGINDDGSQYGDSGPGGHGGSAIDHRGDDTGDNLSGLSPDVARDPDYDGRRLASYVLGAAITAAMLAASGIVGLVGLTIGAILSGTLSNTLFDGTIPSKPPSRRPTQRENEVFKEEIIDVHLDQIWDKAISKLPPPTGIAAVVRGQKIGRAEFATLGRLIRKGGKPGPKQVIMINEMTIAQRKVAGLFINKNGNVIGMQPMSEKIFASIIRKIRLSTDQQLGLGFIVFALSGDRRGSLIDDLAGTRVKNSWNRMRVNTIVVDALNAYKALKKRAAAQ